MAAMLRTMWTLLGVRPRRRRSAQPGPIRAGRLSRRAGATLPVVTVPHAGHYAITLTTGRRRLRDRLLGTVIVIDAGQDLGDARREMTAARATLPAGREGTRRR